MRNRFAAAPLQVSDPKEWNRRISDAVNNTLRGNTNNLGQVTLAVAPATTTTITNSRITPDTAIFFTPRTLNAAIAIAAMYAVCGAGSVVITHAATAAADKTFDYILVG